MNWTGGKLQLHARNTDTTVKRQQQHFAKVRKRRQFGHPDGSLPFHPEFLIRKDAVFFAPNNVDSEASGDLQLRGRGLSRQPRLDEYESTVKESKSGSPEDQGPLIPQTYKNRHENTSHIHDTKLDLNSAVSSAVRDEREPLGRRLNDNDFQQKKLMLLNQDDWAGLRLTRPLPTDFSERAKKGEFGKRRKVNRRQLNHQGGGTTAEEPIGHDLHSGTAGDPKPLQGSGRLGQPRNLSHSEDGSECRVPEFSTNLGLSNANSRTLLSGPVRYRSRPPLQYPEAIDVKIGRDALQSTQLPETLMNTPPNLSTRWSDMMLLDNIHSPKQAPVVEAQASKSMLLKKRQLNISNVPRENESSPCPQNYMQEQNMRPRHGSGISSQGLGMNILSYHQFRPGFGTSPMDPKICASFERGLPVQRKKKSPPKPTFADCSESTSDEERLKQVGIPNPKMISTYQDDGQCLELRFPSRVERSIAADENIAQQDDADELWRKFVFGDDLISSTSEHSQGTDLLKMSALDKYQTFGTSTDRPGVEYDEHLQGQFSDAQSQNISLAANYISSEK